jgi:hypothetical protein
MKKSTLKILTEEFKEYLKENDLHLCKTYRNDLAILSKEKANESSLNTILSNNEITYHFANSNLDDSEIFKFLKEKKVDTLIAKEELLSFIHQKKIKDDAWYSYNKVNGLDKYQNKALEYLSTVSEDYVFDYVNRSQFITSNIEAFDYILGQLIQSQGLKNQLCSMIMSQHKLKFADYQTQAFSIIKKYATEPEQYYTQFTFVKPQVEIENDLFLSHEKYTLEVILNHNTLNSYNVNKKYPYKDLISGIDKSVFALNDYLELLKVDSINILQDKDNTKVLFCSTEPIQKQLIENMLSAHLRAFLKQDNYYEGLQALNLEKEVIEKIVFEHNIQTKDNKTKKHKI